MSIHIREFQEADREALRRLYQASRQAAFSWQPAEQHLLHDFDHHTAGERVLVALREGTILGFVSIWEPDSFIHHLYIDPSAFRNGIGQALLKASTPYFTKSPTLKCLTANQRATHFYRAQGWNTLQESIGPDGPYWLMENPSLWNPSSP